MNLSQITERAIASQLGALLVENTKFKILISALSAENAALKSRVAELEQPRSTGDDDDTARMAD